MDANVLDYNVVSQVQVDNALANVFGNQEVIGSATQIVEQNKIGLDLIFEALKPFFSVTSLLLLNPLLLILLFIETWLLAQLLMVFRRALPVFVRNFFPEGLVYIVSFLLVYSFIFLLSLGFVFNYFNG